MLWQNNGQEKYNKKFSKFHLKVEHNQKTVIELA